MKLRGKHTGRLREEENGTVQRVRGVMTPNPVALPAAAPVVEAALGMLDFDAGTCSSSTMARSTALSWIVTSWSEASPLAIIQRRSS
jgi:hypothetical protein